MSVQSFDSWQIMEFIQLVRYIQYRTDPRGFFRFHRIDLRVAFRLDHVSLVVRQLSFWCVVLYEDPLTRCILAGFGGPGIPCDVGYVCPRWRDLFLDIALVR